MRSWPDDDLAERARAAQDIRRKPDPCRAVRVFDDGAWDPVQKRVVPDTVGRLVYPADFAYDPQRNVNCSLSEVARLNRLLGPDWIAA